MSGEAWIDKHGDVWTLGDDGLLHTPETQPFPREHVEKKWGPLQPVTKADFLLDGSPEAVALMRAARTTSDDRESECTCAMTEGSQRRCAVHGEDAPDDHEAMRERLVRLLYNAGDGGIWESFDRRNAELVADALLAAGWRDDGDEPVQRARLQAHIDHGNDLRAALDGGPR